MVLKQQSLFDFFEEPTIDTAIDENPLPLNAANTTEINEEPIEINFESSTSSSSKEKAISKINVEDIDVPEDDILFQKKYYAIGKVAQMFKVNISHIRFWEKEFDILKPKLNGKGDRLFRPEDVKNLKIIYHLLKEKRYTIEGAKEFLKKNKQVDEVFAVIEELRKTKHFLTELKLSFTDINNKK